MSVLKLYCIERNVFDTVFALFNSRNVYVELCSQRNKLKDSEILLELHELTEKGKLANLNIITV